MKKWFTNWISGLRKGTDNQKNSFRLKPINKLPENKIVFKFMSYFIFCPKHQTIAVCDNYEINRELAVSLPFIYLSSNIKNKITEEGGLSMILSDDDSQLMDKYKEERLFDTNISYVKRIDIRESKVVFPELICFARLHSNNPVLQCCRKTSKILWMSAEDFQNNETNSLWVTFIKTDKLYKYLDRVRLYSEILENSFLPWAEISTIISKINPKTTRKSF